MKTPAVIIMIAGIALIIWGVASSPDASHSSFIEGLTGVKTSG